MHGKRFLRLHEDDDDLGLQFVSFNSIELLYVARVECLLWMIWRPTMTGARGSELRSGKQTSDFRWSRYQSLEVQIARGYVRR